jgi:hypothetical protein
MEKEMEGAERQKGLLDKMFSKLASRKLLVWLTATGALFAGTGLESGDWVTLCIFYISGQSVVDIATVLKGK